MRAVISHSVLVILLIIKVRSNSQEYCEIPPGYFDGMVDSSSISEPYYGFFSTVEIQMTIERVIWSCLPNYCKNLPCSCSSNDKKESADEVYKEPITCFQKTKRTSNRKNVCVEGYEEDELHVCRKAYNCAENNGYCDQLCRHNDTSNKDYCACTDGFQRIYNGKNGSCVDINECQNDTLNKCQEKNSCKNTLGGFNCNCSQKGYILDKDNVSCIQMITNFCETNNGGCQHICKNYVDKPICECNPGYKLDVDQKSCIDVNECMTNNGQCQQECRNNDGSYYCFCRTGTILDNDKTSCIPGPKELMHSETNSNFPWPYILAIILAAFLFLVICIVVICLFLRKNKNNNTRVEKTTVVHYEKSDRKNDAPRVYIVPEHKNYDSNRHGHNNNNNKIRQREDEDVDNPYDGVGNLKALTDTTAPIHKNAYKVDEYDYIDDGVNPVHKKGSSKSGKDKVYTLDQERRASRKNSCSTTDDDYGGSRAGSSKEVSIVYNSNQPDTGKRNRSYSESYEGKGKGSGKGSGSKNKSSVYGNGEDGNRRNSKSGASSKNSDQGNNTEGTTKYSSGKVSSKDKDYVYDIPKNSEKGSKGNGEAKYSNGKSKSSSKDTRISMDTDEYEKKKAKSVKEKYGSSSDLKNTTIYEESASSSSKRKENDYSGKFVNYDQQNNENDAAVSYSEPKKSKFNRSMSVDGTYANSIEF